MNDKLADSKGIKRRDANDILSANNVVPGYSGNPDVMDPKRIKENAINKIWGGKKTVKQEVKEQFEDFEKAKSKRGRKPKNDTPEN